MNEAISLTALRPGQRAVVCDLSAAGETRRRLQDMGLISGTQVCCLGRSPLGDPCAYRIRGAVIALRSEDSGRVRVVL
ncbi:MAG: FeoA family protein [Pseudoflavonifractor sp.]|nr:FeoA family protein [Pseudoflavonifractor sp.]